LFIISGLPYHQRLLNLPGAVLLALVGLVVPIPWVGYIITGLLIGRGANFVHDFASRWLTPAR
jgi:hypothetical protein